MTSQQSNHDSMAGTTRTAIPAAFTRRRLAAITVPPAIAAGAAMASCAGGGAAPTPAQKPVTIRFLTNWAGGARLDLLQNTDRYLSPPPDNMKVPLDTIPYAVPMPFNARFQPWIDAITMAADPAFTGAQTVGDAAKEATRLGDLALAG